MLRKIAKTAMFASIIASALCAGAVTVRQLRSQPQQSVCAGRCESKADCLSGCVCSFTTPFTPGFCTTKLAGNR